MLMNIIIKFDLETCTVFHDNIYKNQSHELLKSILLKYKSYKANK